MKSILLDYALLSRGIDKNIEVNVYLGDLSMSISSNSPKD